jgi:hypothetical protein
VSAACTVNLSAGQWRAAPLPLPCGQPAAYRAWIRSCSLCQACQFPACAGHPVCAIHGAQLRTVDLPDRDRPAELVRLHAIARLPGGQPRPLAADGPAGD